MGALNASGHIRRPKPARTSRRAMIVIAVLALCVLALIAVDLAGVL